MRELRTCDFCGADAVGTFEIVPPELEPTEAEQRRVVLCPDCKGTLRDLLEPLLDRAGVDGDASTDDESANKRSADARARSDDVHSSRSDHSDHSSQPPAERADPDADTAAGTEPSDEPTSSNAPSPAVELEGGITFEHADESPADDADPSAADSDETEHDETDGTDETVERGGDEDDGPSDESADKPPATPPSRAYGKVIRLLRNREFPMKRSDVASLAAGAYDLEDPEVDEIIDYAIEDGEFVENRGKLKRP
ncbi:hypothetical protein [Natronolimnohabitans innermongolicus]|uniref:Uncharacterized protein n=1 Tax=Natronolimnohabitans innermongolicus JCM 12255 TaxID=1227499 RepID=L9X3B6_9EURY|nr:hypothetical protein [Natronolimnohabitans innermongolicus]ELY55058.1 hypothetical protein C493_11942 [Natronolimnohabitans innermongolicus JCM 12255]